QPARRHADREGPLRPPCSPRVRPTGPKGMPPADGRIELVAHLHQSPDRATAANLPLGGCRRTPAGQRLPKLTHGAGPAPGKDTGARIEADPAGAPGVGPGHAPPPAAGCPGDGGSATAHRGRPTEICLLRPLDLDMRNPNCWIYRPGSVQGEHGAHKT